VERWRGGVCSCRVVELGRVVVDGVEWAGMVALTVAVSEVEQRVWVLLCGELLDLFRVLDRLDGSAGHDYGSLTVSEERGIVDRGVTGFASPSANLLEVVSFPLTQ
jgi:hypothetical protein